MCAFDLLELDGRDMRGVPIEQRKAALAKLLRRSTDGIALQRRQRDYLQARLRTRLREHRVETPGITLPRWTRRLLDRGQKSGGAGGHTAWSVLAGAQQRSALRQGPSTDLYGQARGAASGFTDVVRRTIEERP
jgi:hypothetical protein